MCYWSLTVSCTACRLELSLIFSLATGCRINTRPSSPEKRHCVCKSLVWDKVGVEVTASRSGFLDFGNSCISAIFQQIVHSVTIWSTFSWCRSDAWIPAQASAVRFWRHVCWWVGKLKMDQLRIWTYLKCRTWWVNCEITSRLSTFVE